MTVQHPDTPMIRHRAVPSAVEQMPQPELPTRHFDLPVALHAATLGLFLIYLAVMGTTFAGGRMVIVMAICAISVLGMFLVPALFQTMGPAHADKPPSMAAFARDGIDCLTGRLTAGEASAQVLIMPVLIFGWGVAVAVIAAVVR